MRKVDYGNNFFMYAPEKGDILDKGHAYVCPGCMAETASEVLSTKIIDSETYTFRTKCLVCDFEADRNFDLPEGESAYDFVDQAPVRDLFDSDEPFDEYDEFDQAMDDDDPEKLARLVLHRFTPEDSDNMIRIDDAEMRKLVFHYFELWVKNVLNSQMLSPSQKQNLATDRHELFKYLIKNVKTMPAVAFNFLTLDYFKKSERISLDFVSSLFMVSNIYYKTEDNDHDDHVALKNIFEYIIELYDKINPAEFSMSHPMIREIKHLTLRKLGEMYILLEEPEKAVECYKRFAHDAVYDKIGYDKPLEKTTLDIMGILLEKGDIDGTINFMKDILNEDYTFFKIKEYSFDDKYREMIEIQLVEIYRETGRNISELTD